MTSKLTAADSTQARIVEAAIQEFAAYGIAGARIERIAKAAATSKERVYAYFRSKEDLYMHVMDKEVALILDATHLDARDLPSYAAQLFDYFERNPIHFRLLGWGRMEAGGVPELDSGTLERIQRKLDQITQAQAEGALDSRWAPADVLALINQIAVTHHNQVEIAAMAPSKVKNQTLSRRDAVVEAVRRIFPAISETDSTSPSPLPAGGTLTESPAR